MPGKSPVSYTIYPNNTTNLAHPAGSKTAKPSKTVAPVIDGNRNTVDKGKLPLFVEKKKEFDFLESASSLDGNRDTVYKGKYLFLSKKKRI